MIARQDDDQQPSDILCIQRALSGDPKGFEELVDRYSGVIFSLAFRMLGHREDAEEAVQEVFLRAYRALDTFKVGQRFHPWIYTIAVNHLRTVARRRVGRRRDQTSSYDDGISGEYTELRYESPSVAVMRKEAEEAVNEAIGKLKPKYREAFVLFEISELPIAEIADILGVPENTVKTRLRRARAALAAMLSKEGWP